MDGLAPAAARPSWEQIPDALRRAITVRTGEVEHAVTPGGGFTPGLAVRLLLVSGERIFVKALPCDHPLAASYRHEAAAAGRIPAGAPAPALRWHAELTG
jgi:hypothetical protein